jgi:predicted dehydrogenase
LARVRQFSPAGLDAAVITAATPSSEPLELASEILRDRGRIVVVGDVGMGVSRRKLYDKELSIALSRSYGPGRYDANYEEKGIDYPIGYVRWTERRNMEAFLELLASGSIDLNRLTTQQCEIEDAESAYALIREKKAYTVILTYPQHRELQPSSRPRQRQPVGAILPRTRPTGASLKLSCIGAGAFARDVVFPHFAKMRGVELHAVATSSGYSAQSALRTYRFTTTSTAAEIIADQLTDAVLVLSRHDSHAHYVAKALAAGKAVFCEKPLAVNRLELTTIADQYDSQVRAGSNPFLMVGFNRRFAPLAVKVREFFAERREPMIVHIRVNAGQLPREHWTHRDGGRIVGEACHFVDFARALVNSPIENVWASPLPDGSAYRGDNVVANLSFLDGSIANILYVANGDKSIPKEFYEIFCGGSIARLDDFRILELAHNGHIQRFKSKRDKGHTREFELTIEALRNGRSAPIPFPELVEVTEATFRIAEANGTALHAAVESSSMIHQL